MSSLTSSDPMREKYYAVHRKKQQSFNALLVLSASSSKNLQREAVIEKHTSPSYVQKRSDKKKQSAHCTMNLNSKKYLENTICHCRNCHKKGTIISHCVRSSDQVETSITVIWRAQLGKMTPPAVVIFIHKCVTYSTLCEKLRSGGDARYCYMESTVG